LANNPIIEKPHKLGSKIECQVHLPALKKATRVLKPIFIAKSAILLGILVGFSIEKPIGNPKKPHSPPRFLEGFNRFSIQKATRIRRILALLSIKLNWNTQKGPVYAKNPII
jgi:hypothetical protein